MLGKIRHASLYGMSDNRLKRLTEVALKPRIKFRVKSCRALPSNHKEWKLTYYDKTSNGLHFTFKWFPTWFECIQELAWAYAHKQVIH